MRRRSFLARISAFFGFGSASEAAALDEAEREQIAATRQFSTDIPLITPKGTIFRCVNGHPVCEAVENLIIGDEHWLDKIGHWRQAKPKVGDFVRCALCHSHVVLWTRGGVINGGINA